MKHEILEAIQARYTNSGSIPEYSVRIRDALILEELGYVMVAGYFGAQQKPIPRNIESNFTGDLIDEFTQVQHDNTNVPIHTVTSHNQQVAASSEQWKSSQTDMTDRLYGPYVMSTDGEVFAPKNALAIWQHTEPEA